MMRALLWCVALAALPPLVLGVNQWTELQYASNLTFTPRYNSAAGFFPGSRQVFIFGGRGSRDLKTGIAPILNDAWLFSVVSARHVTVGSGAFRPAHRHGHSGVAVGDNFIVFGGQGLQNGERVAFNDVWEYNSVDDLWVDVTPLSLENSPGRRQNHAAAYIEELNIMVVCGGKGVNNNLLRDAWYLDLNNERYVWVRIPAETQDDSACGRYKHSGSAYRNTFVVFGGMDSSHRLLSDLWRLSLTSTNSTHSNGAQRFVTTWKQLFSATRPPASRAAHVAVVVGNRLILHGGLEASGFGPMKAQRDTWFFDFNTFRWKLIPVSGEQPVISHHMAISDDTNMWLLAGLSTNPNEPINSVFKLQGEDMSRVLPSGPVPAGRYGHVSAVDHLGALLLVYGGEGVGGKIMDDVWQFSFKSRLWQQLSPPSDVKPRAHHTLTSSDCFLFTFGGVDADNVTTNGISVWHEPSLSSFRNVDLPESAVRPPPRAHHSAVVLDEKLIVFGGHTGATALSDVWQFTVTNAQPAGYRPSVPGQLFPDVDDAPEAVDGVDRMAVFGLESFVAAKYGLVRLVEATVEFWILLCTVSKPETVIFSIELGCGTAGISVRDGYFIIFPCSPSSPPRITQDATLGYDAKWHHVAGYWPESTDGTVAPELYVDGVRASLPFASYEVGSETQITYSQHNYNFKLCEDDTLQTYVDTLRIWSSRRTPQQLRDTMYSVYIGTPALVAQGLMGIYNFDYNSRFITVDTSGNKRHATLGASVQFAKPLFATSLAPFSPASSNYSTQWISGSWNELVVDKTKPFPVARHSHATDTIGRTAMVVFGGYDQDNQQLNDVWVMHVTAKRWERLRTGGTTVIGFGNFATINFKDLEIMLVGPAPENPMRMSLSSYAVGAQQLTPFSPVAELPPLTGVSLVPNKQAQEALLFGGHLSTKYYGNALVSLSFGTKMFTKISVLQGPIPVPRYWPRMGDIGNGRFLLYGGWGTQESISKIWQYDVNQQRWTSLNVVQEGPRRDSHATVVYDGMFYVFGGEDQTLTHFNTLWKYSPDALKWTLLNTTNTPSPRAYLPASVARGLLWVFGGIVDYAVVLSDLWSMDFVTLTWTRITPAPGAFWPPGRWGHISESIGGDLYIFGGQTGASSASSRNNELFVYSIATQTWTQIVPQGVSPSKRRDASSATTGKFLLVFGGTSEGSASGYAGDLNDLWAFNTDNRAWALLRPLGNQEAPYLSSAALFVDGAFAYVFGGASVVPPPRRYSAELWRFDLATAYPKYCKVSGFKPEMIAKETMTLVISAYNIFGIAKTSGGDIFTIEITGSVQFQPEVTDLANGQYVSDFEIERVGDYNVEIKLLGELLTLERDSFAVHPGKPSAVKSKADGMGLSAAIAGVWSLFTVMARDVADNPLLSNGEVGVTIGPFPAQSVIDKLDGSFQVRYLLTIAGTFQTSVVLNDFPISGSPFTTVISSGTTDTKKTMVWGTGTTTAQAGTSGVVQVQTVDLFGNNKTGIDEDDVQIVFPEDDITAAQGKDRNNTVQDVVSFPRGRYQLSYLPFVAGMSKMIVTVNDVQVGDPYLIEVKSVYLERTNLDSLSIMVIALPIASFLLGILVFVAVTWWQSRRVRAEMNPGGSGEASEELRAKQQECVEALVEMSLLSASQADKLKNSTDSQVLAVVELWKPGDEETTAKQLISCLS